MSIGTLDTCISVVATFLFHLDFAAMQTILPYNQHTTLVDNSNYYNFLIPIHECHPRNFFAILYLAELAYMQSINRSPTKKNGKH